MNLIKEINAFEILDSRGNPTIKCEITLESGLKSVSCVPSGASTGALEAYELRDCDKSRYRGKGVLKAISNINNIIAPKLIGCDPSNQKELDDLMICLDGSDNLSNLGANAILAVSMTIAKVSALSLDKELYEYIGNDSRFILPVPFMNILNGGEHANNNIDIQEFMIVPAGFATFSSAMQAGVEIYHALANLLSTKGHSTSVGDEGGFAPNFETVTEVFDYMSEAVSVAGYTLGKEIFFAIDAASTEFYHDNKYVLKSLNTSYSSIEWANFLVDIVNKYPIISIEDGMAEDDYEGWKILTEKLGEKVQLVGDDLFVTQEKVLRNGINENLANSILIKPNQVGSITGTLMTINLAKQNNYSFMVSHRSGETCDTTIADLAIATSSGQIKTGAPSRGERLAKYNRILEVEYKLGSNAVYAGLDSLNKYISNKDIVV